MRTFRIHHSLPVALAALALQATSAAALAQPPESENQVAEQLPQVTIMAPRSAPTGDRSTIGAPIELGQLTYRVGYSDIDVSTYSGAQTLKNRVYYAALDACHKLDRMSPIVAMEGPPTEQSDCFRDALNSGIAQANQAIALAEQERARVVQPEY